MVDPVPVQPSAKCEACGHTDEKHITTGETDIDGRPVGGSYDYCEDCQARGDDSFVHDFKAMPVAPLCETCGKPIWQTSLGDWFHADGYEPTHRALSNKLFKPVAGRWWQTAYARWGSGV